MAEYKQIDHPPGLARVLGEPAALTVRLPVLGKLKFKNWSYQGAPSHVEYETIYQFRGTACGIDKMEAIIAASQICDEYGVDTLAYSPLPFVMECFEKNRITAKETDGWESDSAMMWP